MLAAVREAVGDDRLVGVRLVGDELVDGGVTVRDAPDLARGLAASGLVDYLNVIAGTNMRRMSRVDHWPASPAGTGIWRHLARAVRDAVDIPVCTVGRVNHPDIALDILAAGDADLVGIARAHIVDAEFLQKTRAGRAADIRPCSAVNVCINALLHDEPIRCLANPEIGREGTIDESDVGGGRTAVVVGGGPGGIEAARRLAARGFAVRLYERGDALGGQMRIWTAAPARTEVQRLIGWWERDLARRGVEVRLGVEATVDVVVRPTRRRSWSTRAAPCRSPTPRWRSTDRRVFDAAASTPCRPATCWSPTRCGRADAMLLAEALRPAVAG